MIISNYFLKNKILTFSIKKKKKKKKTYKLARVKSDGPKPVKISEGMVTSNHKLIKFVFIYIFIFRERP